MFVPEVKEEYANVLEDTLRRLVTSITSAYTKTSSGVFRFVCVCRRSFGDKHLSPRIIINDTFQIILWCHIIFVILHEVLCLIQINLLLVEETRRIHCCRRKSGVTSHQFNPFRQFDQGSVCAEPPGQIPAID